MYQWEGFGVHRVVVWSQDETTDGNRMFSRPPKEAGFESLAAVGYLGSKVKTSLCHYPSWIIKYLISYHCESTELSVSNTPWMSSLNRFSQMWLQAQLSSAHCVLLLMMESSRELPQPSVSPSREKELVQSHDRPEKWANSHEVCTAWLPVKHKWRPDHVVQVSEPVHQTPGNDDFKNGKLKSKDSVISGC